MFETTLCFSKKYLQEIRLCVYLYQYKTFNMEVFAAEIVLLQLCVRVYINETDFNLQELFDPELFAGRYGCII